MMLSVKGYFNRFAEEHPRQNRHQYYWYRWLLDTVTRSASSKKGHFILDLGTGNAALPIKLSPKVGPGGKIIGIDIAEKMMEEARKAVKRLQLENIEMKALPIEAISFPPQDLRQRYDQSSHRPC